MDSILQEPEFDLLGTWCVKYAQEQDGRRRELEEEGRQDPPPTARKPIAAAGVLGCCYLINIPAFPKASEKKKGKLSNIERAGENHTTGKQKQTQTTVNEIQTMSATGSEANVLSFQFVHSTSRGSWSMVF